MNTELKLIHKLVQYIF